jgi:hypothetical protein
MKEHGFKNVREMFIFGPEELLMIHTILSSQPEVVSINNGHLAVDVVPLLAGRALRIVDLESGECATAYNVKSMLFFPFCGGLESRVGEQFRWYGWLEPAKVIERTDESVTIALQTMNGFNLQRKMTLMPDKPVLKVSTTLTNTDSKPKDARLRSHLELDLGDLKSTQVSFTSLDGQEIKKDMTDIIAGLREGEYYRSGNTPHSSWTFTGTRGLKLTQRFNNEQIDYVWLYAYPEDLNDLEVELWCKIEKLDPGQSVSMDYEIEVGLFK